MPSDRQAGSGSKAHSASRPSSDTNSSTEAVVEKVGFEVAHDSGGIVIVTLVYPNHARAQLQLEGDGIRHVLERLGLENVRELIGRAFSELAPALPMNSPK
jgi:hypothetical protein